MTIPSDIFELDSMVQEADATGDHLQLAELLCAIADQSPSGPGSLRAEVLVAAAEQFQLSGRPDRGLECARQAVSDGGDSRFGVQAHLAAALHAAGDHEAARAVIADLRRTRPTDLRLHWFIGVTCEQNEDLDDALRWYTRGLVLAGRNERGNDADEGSDEDIERYFTNVGQLLLARCRTRGSMGLPPDDWDAMALRIAAEARRSRQQAVPAQRHHGPRLCPCGSGRKARRCCGRAAPAYDVPVAVISERGGTTTIDLVSVSG